MDHPARSAVIADRLDELVFARLSSSAKPPSAAELARALRGAAPPTVDDARWSSLVAESVARLRAAGRLDDGDRVTAGASAPLALVGAPGVDWKKAWDRIVPALALGVAANDTKSHARLKDRDAWVAAILGRARDLWTAGPPPSLSSIGDALIWQLLSLPGKPGRSPKALRAHFVTVALGAGSGEFERRAALLAAREVGAARADLSGLREALIRRWLAGQTWGAPPASPAGDFPAAVRTAAARASAEARFGPRKVFVAALWRDPSFQALPLDELKRRLLAAHRAGSIALARADLTAAMDPDLVRDSEIGDGDSRYHFVEQEAP